MKKILFSILLLLVVIGVTSCSDISNQGFYQLDQVDELNFEIQDLEDGEIETISEHPKLQLYLKELKALHDDLELVKSELKILHEDTKVLRDDLKANETTLSETDRTIVGDALRSIQFNKFMFKETIGDGYLQLVELRDHSDDYTQEEAKEIMIDVYHVLKTREAIYHTIYNELSMIHSVLSTY